MFEMDLSIQNLVDNYNYMMSRKDPRVDGWLLMGSPFYTPIICASYIYFVKSLGPKLMRDRKPFELKLPIIIYNIVQVVFSIYVVYKGLVHAWLYRYSLTCQPIDYSDDPDELIVVEMCWWYYICKLTEFLDTVFFVLRKKNDQITNLHVIHHSIMPAAVWWGVRFSPGGHGTFFGILNTFVHVVMYSYYLLAAMGPKFQKYLWWKKHLTTLQMVQFVAVFLHTIQLFFNDCNYPKIIAYAMCFNSVMFMGLFTNFYIQAYIKRRRLPNMKKDDGDSQTKAVEEKASKEKKDAVNDGVGSIFYRIFNTAAAACYMDQNGLHKKAKETTNGYAKRQPAAYTAARQRNMAKEESADFIRWTPN